MAALDRPARRARCSRALARLHVPRSRAGTHSGKTEPNANQMIGDMRKKTHLVRFLSARSLVAYHRMFCPEGHTYTSASR